jgi:hypothetical protein
MPTPFSDGWFATETMRAWLPGHYRIRGLASDVPSPRRWPHFRITRVVIRGLVARARRRRTEKVERNLRIRHFGFVSDHVFSMTPHSWVCRNCPFWRCHERGYGPKYRWQEQPERFQRIGGAA